MSALDERFARMAVADYHALISAALEAHDMEGAASAIRVMAVYHPREAGDVLDLIDLIRGES